MKIDSSTKHNLNEASQEKSSKSKIKEFLSTYLLSILIAFTFVSFVNITFVSGSSMYPTLQDRDVLLMEKGSIMFNNLNRGDIISFRQPVEGNKTVFYIKRIIGVPGNTVEIKNGNVYVNERLIKEDYLPSGVTTLTPDGETIRITLDKDEYFVLGDNRDNSLDSRFEEVGVVSKKQIVSKKVKKLFNLPQFKK